MKQHHGGIREVRGRFQIRWTAATGERRAESYATREEAELELARRGVEKKEERLGLRAPSSGPHLFDELCTEWLTVRAARKRSKRTDESFIRVHLLPAFGGLRLSEISFQGIERYKASKRHLHPNTIDHHLTLLGSMLRHAKDVGWISELPKIKKYRPKTESYRWLQSAEEVRRFLDAARAERPFVFAFYATALLTGLRAGELAGLRWDDIDFAGNLVHVKRSYDGPTKSGSPRYLPIQDELAPILKAWRLHTSGPLVFPNKAGNMLERKARIFSETLRRVLKRAGFTERYLSFHALRHTFASHWMMTGGDLYKLQMALGHHSPEMTQRYAHLSPAVYAADRSRLSALVPKAEGADVIAFERKSGA
jgi:integrase